jgi:TatD DNase family protein
LVELVDIGININTKTKLSHWLARSAAAGVTRVMLTGTSIRSCHLNKTAAEKHLENRKCGQLGVSLYFTAGVHPHDSGGLPCTPTNLKVLSDLHQHPLCVAVGEAGLDYDRMKASKEVQLQWFEAQVKLAAEQVHAIRTSL